MPKKTTPSVTEPQTQPVPEQNQPLPTPTPEPVVTAEATAGTTETVEAPVNTAPINFEEPVGEKDLVAGVGDTPDAAVPLLTPEQMANLQREAENDNTKRDFTLKVLAAREKKDETPPAPPPLAPRMADQTNAEIEAGRKMNAVHAALAAKRPAPVPSQADGRSTAVFRPADYVPDQKKGQGYVQGRGI